MSTSAPPTRVPAPAVEAVTEESAWELHPRVALRPERFGALLYHFQTRRLTFVKDRRLLAVLTDLSHHPRVGDCYDAVGVDPELRNVFTAALQRLADADLLRPVHAGETM